jgi:glycosyltransferase involved in cell wall biosynthesis
MKTATSRITVFLSSLRTGGAERAMLMFCAEASRQGHRVDLVVSKAGGHLQALVPPEIPVVYLRCSRTRQAIVKLALYLRAIRPDALFTTVRNANVIAICAAKLSRLDIPVVVRESSAPLSSPKKSLVDTITNQLVPITYSRARGIIAVSDGVARELRSMSRSLESRVTVIPTPVISSDMLAQADLPIDHPWFTKPEAPVIVCAARIERYKGYDTLICAFQQLRRTTDVKLLILGNGSYQAEIQRRVAELECSNDISFLGFVTNPFPYMKRAHTLVLASEYEGLPNVLIQALAFGTPVVSTDCKSGPAEILCHGKYGQLVPVGDVPALAQALGETIRKPRQIEAQQYVRAKYSAERATVEYLALAGLGEPKQRQETEYTAIPKTRHFQQSSSPFPRRAH